jgi:hypothetical protein
VKTKSTNQLDGAATCILHIRPDTESSVGRNSGKLLTGVLSFKSKLNANTRKNFHCNDTSSLHNSVIK